MQTYIYYIFTYITPKDVVFPTKKQLFQKSQHHRRAVVVGIRQFVSGVSVGSGDRSERVAKAQLEIWFVQVLHMTLVAHGSILE